MELTKIKMAGFKSFVDPITIPFTAQWNCIVGPNGCGKSNTIDAVRCVMGESAAKQLRGGAMEDMIFNGCATRKPAGQASIELFFDNSDGSLGGPYAAYSEIAIKRTVNRDGQSNYYLNGTRCRRRDINDVFLGTGLGPRSYSIIEQGTISRVVEAKPLELRNYLEEAAGVSKYKERRRETENRIKHTRENLARVEDLRHELDKQQSHLQRQANAAERYQELKAQARITDARRVVLNWVILDEERQTQNLLIEQSQTALEEHLAGSQSAETLLTELDMEFADKQEDFGIKQAKVYETVGEINKLEQQIEYTKKNLAKRNEELAEIESNLAENQEHLGGDQSRLEELLALKEEIAPDLEQLRQEHETASQALRDAESESQSIQSRWENCQQQYAQSERQVDINSQKKEHLSAQAEQCERRIEEIQGELKTLNKENQDIDLTDLTQALAAKTELYEQKQQTLRDVKEHIGQNQQQIEDAKSTLSDLQEQKQVLQGELSSLRALQKTALGKHQEALNDWLNQHALTHCPRLAEQLDVDPQWATAVETVLNQDLEALCVDTLTDIVNQISDWPAQSVSFLLAKDRGREVPSQIHFPRLASKVRSEQAHPILQQVFAVESLAQAMAALPQCQAHESFITPEGIWLSPQWLKIIKKDESQAGVLQREKLIKEKQDTLEQVIADIEDHQIQIQNLQTQLSSYEEQAESLRQTCQDIASAQAEIKGDLRALQARSDEYTKRCDQLQRSLTEQQGRLAQTQESYQQVITSLEEERFKLSAARDMKTQLEGQRSRAQETLIRCREAALAVREGLHEQEIKWKTIETELSSVDQAQSRLAGQIERLQQQKQSILTQIESQPDVSESLQLRLESALNDKLKAEEACNNAKATLEAHEHRRRELDQTRSQSHHEAERIREKLEKMRISLQTITVKQTGLMEQFEQTDFIFDDVKKEMPSDANLKDLTQELEKIDHQISRLGAINLAAIDEYKTVSERKIYLDSQNDDLEKALATLEAAIKKIDQETRSKLRETFDKINAKFQELFPRVFGGGQASLVLTEQDWLTTGISIMARPPGKRNASIHMLSGGEKALTAIAFVFSIFHLNAAPFCMLDEVDAPLDDANVERFCRLVEEMSKHVKFIVISHNKLTISKAKNLIGVTMKEPGVSRTVSVDVEEAISISE